MIDPHFDGASVGAYAQSSHFMPMKQTFVNLQN